MRETIIQFGEGVFLRGFVDAFLNTMNKQGVYDGQAVIVQPRAGGRIRMLRDQNYRYNLYLHGLLDGTVVSEHLLIESISRGIDPYTDFDDFLALAENRDFRFVVSNTTEAGITFDGTCQLNDRPCLSFPGKVTQLLYRRYQLGLPGFVFLPCELIDSNGDRLKECVLQYVRQWNLEEDFVRYIEDDNIFANTLVDRIVTGYQPLVEDDRCLNTAELYGLWVIEGNFENELPLQAAGLPVIWTDVIAPYKKRKVRVLNGAHTSTVFPALLSGIETVGEAMSDADISAFLRYNLFHVILPALGQTEENLLFAEAVLERFSNPYIQHKWEAIAMNSVSKFSVRVLPTMVDFYDRNRYYPKSMVFSLACLIKYYREHSVSDEAYATDCLKTKTVEQILSDETLWGMDLSDMAGLLHECLDRMECEGMREAVKWAIS